jgi:ABC-type sugar transport system ATPase subunit
MPTCPPCRSAWSCAGPSGCGKTMLIVSMITDLYRKKDGHSVFKRVYVF